MNDLFPAGLEGAALWLPVVFLMLMGLAVLIYVVLDGYDLGVGILLRRADAAQKDMMVASISPFWDANETWLVLGVGLLLVAFPAANGVILGALYLPVAAMLAGLILRGVAFDFRVKAHADHKRWWDRAFYAGSLLASLSQGVMLGGLITGFASGWQNTVFSLFVGLCLASGYALLGASWLIIKAEGELQRRAIHWAERSLWLTGAGILAVSVVTPFVSERIFEKWFSLPNILLLLPIPLFTGALFVLTGIFLHRLAHDAEHQNQRGLARWCWAPLACIASVFLLAFVGLAYSLFPYLVIDRLTIWDAAAAPESLQVILVGTLVVLPAILVYTAFMYRVFWGKATALNYG